MKIMFGRWSRDELERLIRESSQLPDIGSRIDFLSKHFIGTPYQESTLRGAIDIDEVFIISLDGVDCFTFIDYVEALRLSDSISDFTDNLRKVRYRSGIVSFENRKHFFTDWRERNHGRVHDETESIGMGNTIKVRKLLNVKADGTRFIHGLTPEEREICYIPSDVIDADIIARLKTGDYAGIYSGVAGLDVSHVGIVIKDRHSVLFRHASSATNHKKVVDEDFLKYISEKPGLIILRPNE